MTRAIARSIATALLTGTVLVGADWVRFHEFCARHLSWLHREAGRTVIQDSGPMVARPGDAIFVCSTQHCFEGAIDCHEDLACYCAPASMSAAALGRLVTGMCVLEQPSPSRFDTQGACQHARCDEHLIFPD